MRVVKLDMPIERRRIGRTTSLAFEQKLHLKEIEQLNKEIPLPSAKTRGFVFGAFN